MSTIYEKSKSVKKLYILRENQDLVETSLLEIAELSKEILTCFE